MRRFIVLFLLLLLPIQVLAESIDDLRAVQHSFASVEALVAASPNADAALTRSKSSSTDGSNPQQGVYADISDSVNSAALYLNSPQLFELWREYRLIAIPMVYLPEKKPPRR